MQTSILATAFASAFLVAGCASQVPHPKSFQSTSQQLVPKSAQHWQTMADDIATQTRAVLGDARNEPVYVARSDKKTSFNSAFHDFLITRLMAQGVPVSVRPDGVLTLEYSTQLVRHGSERQIYVPGTLTALTGGLLVARNIVNHGISPVGFAALGIGADIAASMIDSAAVSNLELIVTTSVTSGGRYVVRKSDIYYLNQADASLFIEPRAVPTREYRVVGSGR
jgi:hypothetical protein